LCLIVSIIVIHVTYLYLYTLALALYLYTPSSSAQLRRRSYTEPTKLGQRLMQINDGAFSGTWLEGLSVGPLLDYDDDDDDDGADADVDSKDGAGSVLKKVERAAKKEKQAAVRELYDSADNVSDEAQALVLPIALSAALAGTFFTLNTLNSATTATMFPMFPDSSVGLDLLKLVAPYLPYLALLPTTLVCWLFTKSEVQNIIKTIKSSKTSKTSSDADADAENESTKALPIAIAIAGALVLTAYLPTSTLAPLTALIPSFGSIQYVQWPVQNIVNMCIAITVCRAVQVRVYVYHNNRHNYTPYTPYTPYTN
jgi:hypothetical protein